MKHLVSQFEYVAVVELLEKFHSFSILSAEDFRSDIHSKTKGLAAVLRISDDYGSSSLFVWRYYGAKRSEIENGLKKSDE